MIDWTAINSVSTANSREVFIESFTKLFDLYRIHLLKYKTILLFFVWMSKSFSKCACCVLCETKSAESDLWVWAVVSNLRMFEKYCERYQVNSWQWLERWWCSCKYHSCVIYKYKKNISQTKHNQFIWCVRTLTAVMSTLTLSFLVNINILLRFKSEK